MTDPKEKKPTIKTRPPGRLGGGMFDRVKLPTPGPHPIEEIIASGPTAEPTPPRDSTPSSPSTVSTGSSASTAGGGPIAPARDFARVANSIVREALPWGVFGGKSKQLYDFLYSQTRGAVVPKRSVIISKVKLMAGADIGSEVTLKKNLDRLKAAGLISERVIAGVHGGNEFTVFLPEEITDPRDSTPSSPSTGSSSLYNREPLESLESSPSTPGLIVAAQSGSGERKTSFKTNIEHDDDEAFAGMVAQLKQAAEEVTGKGTSTAERDRWSEVAELLVTELRIAAARTTVSSAPAFLAEHLRRRLRKADARQIEREVAEATAGASTPSTQARPELTHEQIEEQARLLAGLMLGGATIAELEEQFAGNFRPAQWHQIRSIALAQHGYSGTNTTGATRPTDDVLDS